MTIEDLTAFFMWCSIINGSLLLLWSLMCMLLPNVVFKSQNMWFPIPREKYDVLMYSFLGVFKIAVLVFNVVPFIALSIIG